MDKQAFLNNMLNLQTKRAPLPKTIYVVGDSLRTGTGFCVRVAYSQKGVKGGRFTQQLFSIPVRTPASSLKTSLCKCLGVSRARSQLMINGRVLLDDEYVEEQTLAAVPAVVLLETRRKRLGDYKYCPNTRVAMDESTVDTKKRSLVREADAALPPVDTAAQQRAGLEVLARIGDISMKKSAIRENFARIQEEEDRKCAEMVVAQRESRANFLRKVEERCSAVTDVNMVKRTGTLRSEGDNHSNDGYEVVDDVYSAEANKSRQALDEAIRSGDRGRMMELLAARSELAATGLLPGSAAVPMTLGTDVSAGEPAPQEATIDRDWFNSWVGIKSEASADEGAPDPSQEALKCESTATPYSSRSGNKVCREFPSAKFGSVTLVENVYDNLREVANPPVALGDNATKQGNDGSWWNGWADNAGAGASASAATSATAAAEAAPESSLVGTPWGALGGIGIGG